MCFNKNSFRIKYKLYKSILILLTGFTYSCNSCNSCNDKNSKALVIEESKSVQMPDSIDFYTLLTSHMTDTIRLDNFLDKITHQEKVKVLSKLTTKWDESKKSYVYFDSTYIFQLSIVNSMYSREGKSNSIFIDRDIKISFKDYNITCYQDSIYHCENYGFNIDNSLNEPKIIEVCGKRFLYADISYNCNGIGCGCFISFIYDLETHKPTFVENYRIPYKGFYISDFNNDNNPDLLVISSTFAQKMKGFEFDEFELRLTPFSYNAGRFKPHFDNQYERTYGYELYSFTNAFHQSYYDNLIYSITKYNWFREMK